MAIEWMLVQEKEPVFKKNEAVITDVDSDGIKRRCKKILVIAEVNSKSEFMEGLLVDSEGDIYVSTMIDFFFKDIDWEGEMTGAKLMYWAEVNLPEEIRLFKNGMVH